MQDDTSLTEKIVFLENKSFHDLRGVCCLITKDYIIDVVHLTFSKSSLFAPHAHLIQLSYALCRKQSQVILNIHTYHFN